MSTLTLEHREQEDGTAVYEHDNGSVGAILTPTTSADYWEYRVQLSPAQAVLGFPKFGTIGIGFAVENGSSNTNRPCGRAAEFILEQIAVNKGDAEIADADVLEAIEMIRDAVARDHPEMFRPECFGAPPARWQR